MNDFNFLTDQQMIDKPIGQTLIFDIETYRNFFFIGFLFKGTDDVVCFHADEKFDLDIPKLNWFIHRHRLVGFNSENFDIPMLTMALNGASCEEIKMGCDRIIKDGLRGYEFYKKNDLEKPKLPHIDLINVCPLKGALKEYGARLHAKNIQNNPCPVDNFLSEEEKMSEGMYCLNDLRLTELIMDNLEEQLDLRERLTKQYVINVMSSSDAQIAEKVMAEELKKRTGSKVETPIYDVNGYTFKYDAPAWVQFGSPQMQQVLKEITEDTFQLTSKGYPKTPRSLHDRKVRIGKATYKMGIGGLHSTESCQTVTTDDGSFLVDVDVASYYPAIILNNGFAPGHLGEDFLEVYQDLVTRRLNAKKAGNKADSNSLKITINGIFGKFGSKWSKVYSPKLLVQVTLTGQLALLMLIEYAESLGIEVVSANTDGVVFHPKDESELALLGTIVGQWEKHTGFETEETPYKALYSRDVNNYIAVKEDGKVKTKGTYLLPEGIFRFHKTPDCNIVSKALIAYLTEGTPLLDTIEGSGDITDFVVARKVKGGAEFTGEKLGKCVRWYFSRFSTNELTYAESGNKVPNSMGAKPCQMLPDGIPEDLDYSKYLELAQDALEAIGAVKPFQPILNLFTKEDLAELDRVA